MGGMRSPRNGDEEVRLLRHIALHGGGRSLGIRNKAGAARRLRRLLNFYRKAPPSTVDHEGEAAAIHDEEYGNDPRPDKRVCVYKLANTRFVPA